MSKLYFAPVPARAFGDDRLTRLHLRVLGVIAMHDRMSGSGKGNGQGCWVGNQALALKCGCNISNLSTAITQLGGYGYILREPHPLNKRLRIFKVVYDVQDEAFVRSAKADNRLPTGKVSPPDRLPGDQSIVCPFEKKEHDNQGDDAVEYIPLSGKYIPLSGKRNSAEAARSGTKPKFLSKVPADLPGRLAFYERALKSNTPLALHHVLDDLTEMSATFDAGSALHGWSERLMSVVQERIEQAA